jgi:hypothetical protein
MQTANNNTYTRMHIQDKKDTHKRTQRGGEGIHIARVKSGTYKHTHGHNQTTISALAIRILG